jgi:hypothetical protein
MRLDEKKYKLLKAFLDNYSLVGVCGFEIINDDEDDDSYSVMIIFDLDWIKSSPANPDFIARRYRAGLKQEVLNFTGLNIPYVGSMVRECRKKIVESLSPKIRRRLSYDKLKSDIDNSVLDGLNPCDFPTPGHFIAECCDLLKDLFLEDYYNTNYSDISPSDKDKLYHYLVDEFSPYLLGEYKKRCPGKVKLIFRR